jgi:hypothetical protein
MTEHLHGKRGNGQGKLPAARGADGETRKPPTKTVWGGYNEPVTEGLFLRSPQSREYGVAGRSV